LSETKIKKAILRCCFVEGKIGETINETTIMTKETSPLEKELEKIITRHMVQPPKSGARAEINKRTNEKLDVSMHPSIRVQQPIMQRQQYYTGDA
jgi:hypothetical protein